MPIDNTQHGGDQADSENIVGISEEADTCHHDGSYMIPAKGSFVDLRESESSTLVGVGNMSIVVVEIMEGSVATSCALRHAERVTANDERLDGREHKVRKARRGRAEGLLIVPGVFHAKYIRSGPKMVARRYTQLSTTPPRQKAWASPVRLPHRSSVMVGKCTLRPHQ